MFTLLLYSNNFLSIVWFTVYIHPFINFFFKWSWMKNKTTLFNRKMGNDINNEDEIHTFDLIIQETGGFGRFQQMILVLSLISSVVAACNHLSPIYLTYTPCFDFSCITFKWNLLSLWPIMSDTALTQVRILPLPDQWP